jgi:DNA-binding NarL/FixJ family response regulator
VSSFGILIVDDHDVVRSSIRSILSSSECTICGEACDGLEAVEKAISTRPDLVIMDVSMPRMDGVAATKIIRTELPETQVIIISQNDPKLVAKQAAEVRACGSLSKSDLGHALLPLIQTLAKRKQLAFIDPELRL